MSLLPWDKMLHAGLRMGLMPDKFWRLSLKEWRALTGQGAHGSGMGRGDFHRLIDAFPDVSSPACGGGAPQGRRGEPSERS